LTGLIGSHERGCICQTTCHCQNLVKRQQTIVRVDGVALHKEIATSSCCRTEGEVVCIVQEDAHRLLLFRIDQGVDEVEVKGEYFIC